MNSRQSVLVLVNLIILPVLLFNFQNCSSAGPAGATVNGQVSTVEGQNKSEFQFVTADVEIQDGASITGVDGFCMNQYDGTALNWSVSAGQEAGSVLVSGSSVCKGGQFSLEIGQLESLVCGVSHLLVVESDSGQTISTNVTRRCQPLASESVAVPAGSPQGTTCNLEYSPATAAEMPCEEVCYRDSKVVFSQAQDVSQCQSLAASLAGP